MRKLKQVAEDAENEIIDRANAKGKKIDRNVPLELYSQAMEKLNSHNNILLSPHSPSS